MVIPPTWESPPWLVAAADVVVLCESAPWRAYIPWETMLQCRYRLTWCECHDGKVNGNAKCSCEMGNAEI